MLNLKWLRPEEYPVIISLFVVLLVTIFFNALLEAFVLVLELFLCHPLRRRPVEVTVKCLSLLLILKANLFTLVISDDPGENRVSRKVIETTICIPIYRK